MSRSQKYPFQRSLENEVDIDGDPRQFFESVERWLRKGARAPSAKTADALANLYYKFGVEVENVPSIEAVQQKLAFCCWYLEACTNMQRVPSRKAAKALVLAASEICNIVKDLALTKPDLFGNTPHDMDEWPSMISFHPDWQKENEQILKNISLGKKSPLQRKLKVSRIYSDKQSHRSALNTYSCRLVELVEVAREFCVHRRDYHVALAAC